jgi:hypothetical protein
VLYIRRNRWQIKIDGKQQKKSQPQGARNLLPACVNMVTKAGSQCDQISSGVFVGAK